MHYNRQVIYKVVSIHTSVTYLEGLIKRMTTPNRIGNLLDKI